MKHFSQQAQVLAERCLCVEESVKRGVLVATARGSAKKMHTYTRIAKLYHDSQNPHVQTIVCDPDANQGSKDHLRQSQRCNCASRKRLARPHAQASKGTTEAYQAHRRAKASNRFL
jgi:hypothetical protein